jgi:hypothetical protein
MGKLKIAVNGKSLFEWEGDAAEVEKIDQQVRAVANHANLTPDTVAQRSISRFTKFFLPVVA